MNRSEPTQQACMQLLERQEKTMLAFAFLLGLDAESSCQAIQDALTAMCIQPPCPQNQRQEMLQALRCTMQAAKSCQNAERQTPEQLPQQAQQWMQALQMLPFPRRAAAVLRYYFGLSIREIAFVMAKPQLWTAFAVYDAKLRLEKCLQDEPCPE